MPARITIVSGATGTGKTTIAKILAEKSADEQAVHIHSDDFYGYIKKGFAHPWEKGTGQQNEAVIEAVAASAKSFSAKGYEVFVDGVIGPWFIAPWVKIAKEQVDVRYIVLRPNEQMTIWRATEREQKEEFPLNPKVVSGIWQAFADLGPYESYAIDTSAQTPQKSVALIQKLLQEGNFCLR